MRRLLVGLVLGFGALLAATALAAPAEASVRDRIDAHRAEVQAKIACHRAQMEGLPCDGAPEAPAPAAQAQAPAAAPRAAEPPPNVPRSGKAIEVSISEQKLRAWEDGGLVMETPVSTGSPGRDTPRGEFEILSKTPNHWSTQYHVDMPYAMRVVRGIFIHEVPIAPDGRRLGVNDLGRPVSAGCIRVGIGDAERLYRWAEIGTPVIIH